MIFSICNLGCKVNAYEAESISEALIEEGYRRVAFEENADVSIILTCAVTNTAASKSRKMLHRIKRKYPDTITVLVGCYVQVGADELQEADILIGTSYKHEIPLQIRTFLETGQRIVRIDHVEGRDFTYLPLTHFTDHSRGILKIQDGCDQFCTYCIIPHVRGRERSLDPERAVADAVRISATHSEIVLTGIHTGRYGREYNVTLATLMERILAEAKDLKRLRISSIEITEITDELIDLMKRESRIARHLHIPLQAGSDEILKRMGRPYNTQEYYDRIMHIRKEIPGISISTDLMTGFPYETEALFEESYAFLKKCEFSFLHVFPYSEREGTKAASMDHQVPVAERKRRAAKCIALSQESADTFAKQWLDHETTVITELPHDGYTPGYTSEYIPVRIMDREYKRGTELRVRLISLKDHQVYAESE